MKAKQVYATLIKLINDTLAGAGALKGVPCEINKIEEVETGINVEFKWIDTSGTTHTETRIFPKGPKGDTGDAGASVISASVKNKHLILTKDDGTEIDCGLLPTSDYDDSELRAAIGGKVDKVTGKSLIDDTEIARLADVDNYDDTAIKATIKTVSDGLMASAGYSADYKTIDIVTVGGDKKSIDVKPVIEHANIGELADVDSTNKANGKSLVFNGATGKHEYSEVSGTDEKVKMDASGDAKYLDDLLDKVTVVNENGSVKVKKLDGQEATIEEINYLRGLTMNVMDLVSLFATGGLKTLDNPFDTYADLTAFDKSTLLDEVSYLTRVLSDETHENKITAYLIKKEQESPIFYGYLDDSRNFITNPINLATEITGKLGVSNMDVDALATLLAVSVDDTYKTLTSTDNSFGTHGAKAMYDELVTAIGGKASTNDITTHTGNTDIHVSTTEKETWNKVAYKAESSDLTEHTGNADIHVTTADKSKWNASQANVIETVKVNGVSLTPTDKAVDITVPTKISQLTNDSGHLDEEDITTTISRASTDRQVPSAKAVYDSAINEKNLKTYHLLNQLGLTIGHTVQDVYMAMPNGSIAIISVVNQSCVDVPYGYGVLIVEKQCEGKVNIIFKQSYNDSVSPNNMWLGSIQGNDGSGLTWSKVCTTKIEDVDWTVLPKASFVSTGNIMYRVKNGICFVAVQDVSSSTMSTISQTMATGLPIPEIANHWHVLCANNDSISAPIQAFLVSVTGDGSLFTYRGTDNAHYYGTFSYPVAES